MRSARKSTRRRFMQGAAAVLAGAALAPALDIRRMAHAAGTERLRIALIGCGGRGTGATANCLEADPAVQVVALADVFEDRAQKSLDSLQRKFAGRVESRAASLFVGPAAYQQAVRTDADLILIATPCVFHPICYQAAIRAGKHVFMEKPCCVDAPGYRLLNETNKLADEKGLKVGVGFQRRRQRSCIESIQRVHDGAIGRIQSLEACWKGGGIWARERLPGQTEMQWQVYNWINFAWAGGEQIVEQLSHCLDVCNWIMRDHPARAAGRCGRETRYQLAAGDVLDFFEVDYTYAAGVPLHAECYWLPQRYTRVAASAAGTAGTVDGFNGRITGQGEWRYSGQSDNPYQQEHVELIAAIRSGAKYNMGWDGATAGMTGVLGRMAAYEGREVTWEEAIRSNECFHPERFAWDAPAPTLPDKFGHYRVPFRGRMLAT